LYHNPAYRIFATPKKAALKTIDKFIIKSYVGPFIFTFFISLFVLLMQFLWKYLEDLVGKGLDFSVVAELLLYASASLVPLALPLAILLSSIMTFGNFGENYELAAMKASGISLQRVMKPLIIVSIFISMGAFLFSNYVLPYANLKFGALLYDVMNQKPALNIVEGVYYNGIEGYVLRVGKKAKDGKTLEKIFIYDHTQHRGNVKVINAEKGKMEMSTNERYMLLTLYNGNVYEEVQTTRPGAQNFPFTRTSFKEQFIRFDLSAYKMSRSKEDLFKENVAMMNIFQLDAAADTMRMEMAERKKDFGNQLLRNMGVITSENSATYFFNDKWKGDVLSQFNKPDKLRIIDFAMNSIRSSKSYIEAAENDNIARNQMIDRSSMEWHRKFTLSFACLVLFFIGAPLGAIVRKGGLGMPVVLSVLFFLAYHIISISGEKFAKEDVWTPLQGMWLGTMVFLPIGVFLTYKATKDSVLFDYNTYVRPFVILIRKIKSKRNPKVPISLN
jgi:lipopolysaccharide export system permease protein